jgi:hypothetical protein
MASDLTIRIADVQAAGYCTKGARRWFEARGFSFRDFLRNGVPAQTLLKTGDPMAKAVVERAQESDHG